MGKCFLLLSAVLLFPRIFANGQPVNDECSNAHLLAQTYYCSPVTATTMDATQSLPPFVCSGLVGYSDDDVWFSFVAVTSHVTIEVDGSPGFDAVVDFRESPCPGTTIACVDAMGPGGKELLSKTGLYIGNTYLIRVYSYGNGPSAQGTFTICAYGAPPYPPVNDDCTGSIWLLENSICQMFTATTVSASQSDAPILCDDNTGYADDDVWFIFSATTDDPVIIVSGTPLFDPVVDLRTGMCNGTTLFCSDSTGAGGTEVIHASGLTTGGNYHIRVYGYGNGPNDEGEFNICLFESPVTGTDPHAVTSGQVSVQPNPFTGATRISYYIAETATVKILITGLLGNTVAILADELQYPGFHEVVFRPSEASGTGTPAIYYCIVSLESEVITKKIIRLPE